MNQTGRPADLRLRGDLFRQAPRGRESEVRHHQYVALPLRRQSVGPHRLHERRLTARRRQPSPHAPRRTDDFRRRLRRSLSCTVPHQKKALRTGHNATPSHRLSRSRIVGENVEQQCRRPAEVACAVPRPGSGIEVLPKSGTCCQCDHVLPKPLRQRCLAVRSESFGQQPGCVEPRRTSPVRRRL